MAEEGVNEQPLNNLMSSLRQPRTRWPEFLV